MAPARLTWGRRALSLTRRGLVALRTRGVHDRLKAAPFGGLGEDAFTKRLSIKDTVVHNARNASAIAN